jgi:hypothetical protein
MARERAEAEARARAQAEAQARAQAEARARAEAAARAGAAAAARARAQAARREQPEAARRDEPVSVPRTVGNCAVPSNPRGTAQELVCSLWTVAFSAGATRLFYTIQLESGGQVRVSPEEGTRPEALRISSPSTWRLSERTIVLSLRRRRRGAAEIIRFSVVAEGGQSQGTYTNPDGIEVQAWVERHPTH